MLRLLPSLAVVASFAATAAAETIEFAYTPLDTDKCPHRKGREVEDYGSWTCAGYAGIKIHISAGDQRSYVSYGPTAAREMAARQTLNAFNGEGKTIEWRIARDARGQAKPFATIMRWSTAVVVDDPKLTNGIFRGQMLVVTRLGPGGVCHVGYVDGRANPNANEIAREIADTTARTFRCGTDKPVVRGDKGPGFSESSPVDPD
jgi:hypothetical protein